MAPLEQVVEELLARRTPEGVWTGRLSSSALAAAVAVRALKSVDPSAHATPIRAGSAWLSSHQNDDGGWGDTVCSPSNVSTTLLAAAALNGDPACKEPLDRAHAYLSERFGSMEPDAVVAGILNRYGDDRTFSAPILALAAVSGVLGDGRDAWGRVPQLPFELAALPRALFKWLRLDVVSYAVPALIAIGYLRHHRRPTGFPPSRFLRSRCIRPLLKRLTRMQPKNGGFLEAVPLTAFVTMALAESGLKHHAVVQRGVEFLLDSMRDDGSWPIDTNLSTWITSQALKGIPAERFDEEERRRLRAWFERQQFKTVHPFTGSAPGGWGWTPLPGSVPDADDTAGALIALKQLMGNAEPSQAVLDGIGWLLGLQNADGGVPTFCRGWGKLPFDRSCPDVTAHAVEALGRWSSSLPPALESKTVNVVIKAIAYLGRCQREDGSWVPLWFGNQRAPRQENPCYGTSMVLAALMNLPAELTDLRNVKSIERAVSWLRTNQNDDGGWGGCKGTPSTREETALALAALASFGDDEALAKGVAWLNGNWNLPPAPIGLYFSSLWYVEDAYPMVFAARARAALELSRSAPKSTS